MNIFKNLFGRGNSDNSEKKDIKSEELKDGPKIHSFKGVGTENQIINSIYKDRLSRINQWRNKYSKKEYSYKVALNTVYQMLTLKEMWEYIKGCFNKGSVFDDFQVAYNEVQKKSGEISLMKVHNIVESTLRTGSKISIFDINVLNGFVAKAQNGDNEFVEKVELCYFWYTGAVELAYAYAAFGLIGLSKMEALQQISSVIIGGDPDELDNSVGMFGTNIEMCYKRLPELW